MLSKKQKIILAYPKLKERIATRESPAKEKEKVLKNLDEIQSDFSHTYIRSFQKILDASLPKLYDGIDFDDSAVNIKELLKDHCVVLVPNHQSHVDYLAINHMFYKKNKFPLYVAGGANLNIFPIGKLFRKSGCFFIRRSFASDITYKLTLEAYLYYLLKKGRPIEFFFEGGRSRTGKLLSPRFGLYGMLMDAHQQLLRETNRKILFIPVSIVHEYVPETKSLAEELGGAKKKKENMLQLLGLFKLFAYQFGSVHIKLGTPVPAELPEEEKNHKEAVQSLAFQCFREVGKNMMVTPTSLLSLILLDEPSGAMLWQDIISKSKAIISYCQKFNIVVTNNLMQDDIQIPLERAMDILIGNRRVSVIGRENQGQLYYSIHEGCRGEILYSKNTILHHFLIPAIINHAWINIFSGQINSVTDLKEFFLRQRRQLKHEFYLPTVKQFFYRTLNIVSDAVGKKITSLEELINLGHKELYAIASTSGLFSRALSYINEAYFVSSQTLVSLFREFPEGFKFEVYNKRFDEILKHELSLGRIIRYPESSSTPLRRSSLKYFTHLNTVENKAGMIKVMDADKISLLRDLYEEDLRNQLTFNIRVQEQV